MSVGIDIGTSTTSMVLSRLTVQNTATCFSVPRAEITQKEILYRSKIYTTPLENGSRIDIQEVARLLRHEYQQAGITPQEIDTGAVIITGESSRKENAALATRTLSDFAGEFVVATAGPDLESVIAAKGAGTHQLSKEQSCTIANLDIGGGTTNIALFRCGELVGKGALNVGGRLVRVSDGKILSLSPYFEAVAKASGVSISPGSAAQAEELRIVTDRMASLLGEALWLSPRTPLCSTVWIPESSPIPRIEIDALSFSGGVADYIYRPGIDWFCHGDIGPLLADSIRRSPFFRNSRVIGSRETIRATVIGAGAYATTLSGSTIYYSSPEVFPIKNLPVFVPDASAEQAALEGDASQLSRQAKYFLEECPGENLLFCFGRTPAPGYQKLCSLAQALCDASSLLPASQTLIILVEQDFAKSLGQAIRRRLKDGRAVVCIDSIHAQTGDYLDLGRPILNGTAVPAVVKTLLYG